MLLPVPTYNNRFVLKVGIKALRPVIVALKGYDARRANSYYFRRKVPFKSSAIRDGMNYKEISIPMPLEKLSSFSIESNMQPVPVPISKILILLFLKYFITL